MVANSAGVTGATGDVRFMDGYEPKVLGEQIDALGPTLYFHHRVLALTQLLEEEGVEDVEP